MGRVSSRALSKILSRQGVQLEMGEPFPVDGGRRFMCIAKAVGPLHQIPVIPNPVEASFHASDFDDSEPTQTLCVIAEEGRTAAEARNRLRSRLERAGSSSALSRHPQLRRGWLGRLISVFK